jgi:hypothetical protein
LTNGAVTDAGPGRYNGTPASGQQAPTTSADGLSFVATSNQYVSIPCAAFSGAGTFIALVRPTGIIQATALPVVWGSDTATGLGFLASNMGAPSWLSANATNDFQAVDLPQGTFSIAVSPSTGTMWINGKPITGTTTDIPSTPTCTNTAYIGNASRGGGVMNFPFNGTIFSLMKIANPSPTTDQIAQIVAYQWYQKSQQTAVGPVDTTPYTGAVTLFVGDSRAACAGVANTISAAVANCWTYYSVQAAGMGGTVMASVLGGSASSSILNFFQESMPEVDAFAGRKTAVWEGGGIDLLIGMTPEQVLQNIDTAAAVAHTHGMKFVASSVAPSVLDTGNLRQTLNASILARARSGAYDGFIGFSTMPWLNQPTNTKCFLDGFHEVKFCQYQMSGYAACSLAFTSGATQCTLPVIIPYLAWNTNNTTTATINLYDLLPGQRVTQAYYIVTDPMVASGCSAFSTSVGDSTGNPSTYLPGQSYPSSMQALGAPVAFASSNGTVTATFTSVGCNLNAFTRGEIGIALTIEKAQ